MSQISIFTSSSFMITLVHPLFLLESMLLLFLVFYGLVFVLFIFVLCRVPNVACVSGLFIFNCPLVFSTIYKTHWDDDSKRILVYNSYRINVYHFRAFWLDKSTVTCLFLIRSFLYELFLQVVTKGFSLKDPPSWKREILHVILTTIHKNN